MFNLFSLLLITICSNLDVFLFFQPGDQLEEPVSLLNFSTSWGPHVVPSSSSSMETANLIASVLRDFEQAPLCETSTPRIPQPRDKFASIEKQMEELSHKQEVLSTKLDHVIALLTQIAQMSPALQIQSSSISSQIAQMSPTLPCQTAVASNPPSTASSHSIQQTALPSNPPSTVPSIAQPVCSSPLSLEVPQANSNQPPASCVSPEQLFQLKNMAKSRPNFAVQLLKRLFEPSELKGRNIAGAKGKGKVDPTKVNEIKQIVNSFFPVSASEDLSAWRDCRRAMDNI